MHWHQGQQRGSSSAMERLRPSESRASDLMHDSDSSSSECSPPGTMPSLASSAAMRQIYSVERLKAEVCLLASGVPQQSLGAVIHHAIQALSVLGAYMLRSQDI